MAKTRNETWHSPAERKSELTGPRQHMGEAVQILYIRRRIN